MLLHLNRSSNQGAEAENLNFETTLSGQTRVCVLLPVVTYHMSRQLNNVYSKKIKLEKRREKQPRSKQVAARVKELLGLSVCENMAKSNTPVSYDL